MKTTRTRNGLKPRTIRVTDATWKQIERRAQKARRKPSDWVRVTLEGALAQGVVGRD